jgi:hypothetical protein
MNPQQLREVTMAAKKRQLPHELSCSDIPAL